MRSCVVMPVLFLNYRNRVEIKWDITPLVFHIDNGLAGSVLQTALTHAGTGVAFLYW